MSDLHGSQHGLGNHPTRSQRQLAASAEVTREAPLWPGAECPRGGRQALPEVPAGDSGAAGPAALPTPTGLAAAAPLGGRRKRLTDIAIAVTALLVAGPVMLLIALLIRLSSEGPILFAHTRVGFGGRPFRCYKFRTMVVDAERALQEHLARDPAAAREWREAQKLRDDPRVNFVGRMLRKTSLDELPQFFNVLRGDMSCVGPRPIVIDELARYGSFADYYLGTRPGVTGLWQVTGRSNTDYDVRVGLDTKYVRDWTFWIDLIILLRTPRAVTRFAHVY